MFTQASTSAARGSTFLGYSHFPPCEFSPHPRLGRFFPQSFDVFSDVRIHVDVRGEFPFHPSSSDGLSEDSPTALFFGKDSDSLCANMRLGQYIVLCRPPHAEARSLFEGWVFFLLFMTTRRYMQHSPKIPFFALAPQMSPSPTAFLPYDFLVAVVFDSFFDFPFLDKF